MFESLVSRWPARQCKEQEGCGALMGFQVTSIPRRQEHMEPGDRAGWEERWEVAAGWAREDRRPGGACHWKSLGDPTLVRGL